MERLAEHPVEEQDDFPSCGFRARRWLRFERDLHAWLDSPQGAFARWSAVQAIATEG
jgi:hypothetical protein